MPDGGANRIILFDIYFRGAFVGCQRIWAQAHAYIDFLQSYENMFFKASMRPFRMMKFYKDRLALNEAANTPHPTDDSLVIGENGRTYAAARLPEGGWQFAEAWEIRSAKA